MKTIIKFIFSAVVGAIIPVGVFLTVAAIVCAEREQYQHDKSLRTEHRATVVDASLFVTRGIDGTKKSAHLLAELENGERISLDGLGYSGAAPYRKVSSLQKGDTVTLVQERSGWRLK